MTNTLIHITNDDEWSVLILNGAIIDEGPIESLDMSIETIENLRLLDIDSITFASAHHDLSDQSIILIDKDSALKIIEDRKLNIGSLGFDYPVCISIDDLIYALPLINDKIKL